MNSEAINSATHSVIAPTALQADRCRPPTAGDEGEALFMRPIVEAQRDMEPRRSVTGL